MIEEEVDGRMQITKGEKNLYQELKKSGLSVAEIENIIRGEREVEDEML